MVSKKIYLYLAIINVFSIYSMRENEEKFCEDNQYVLDEQQDRLSDPMDIDTQTTTTSSATSAYFDILSSLASDIGEAYRMRDNQNPQEISGNITEQSQTNTENFKVISCNDNLLELFPKLDKDLQDFMQMEVDQQIIETTLEIDANLTEPEQNLQNTLRPESNVDHTLINNQTLCDPELTLQESKNNDESKQFKCDIENCAKKYQTKRQLDRHKREFHSNKVFQCTLCKSTFKYKANLDIHTRAKHGAGYSCSVEGCDQIFTYPYELSDHIKTQHGEGYKCDKCNITYAHAANLREHKIGIHGSGFKCRIENCNETFQGRKGRDIHERNQHKNDIPEQNLSVSQNTVDEISNTDTEDQRVILDPTLNNQHTSLDFTSEKNITSNEKENASSRKRKNNSNTKQKQQSKKRKISQNQEKKQYQCDLCDKSYMYRSGLANHKKGRHGTGYKCTVESCSQVFKDHSYLMDHIKSEHGEGYKCTECNKSFSHAHLLRDHKTGIHGPGFKCRMKNCNENFKRRQTRNHHEQKKHKNDIEEQNLEITENNIAQADLLKNQDVESPEDLTNQNTIIEELSVRPVLSNVIKTVVSLNNQPLPDANVNLMEPEQNLQNALITESNTDHTLIINGTLSDPKLTLEESKNNDQLKQFKCNIENCTKKYQTKRQLDRHKREFHSNKVFQCTICQAIFKYKTNLDVHTKAKHGTGYKCTVEGCNAIFTDHNYFTDHIKTEHGEGYKCDECNTTYTHAVSLREHIRGKHGPGFKCRIENCNETFPGRKGRDTHERTQHKSDVPKQNLSVPQNTVDEITTKNAEEQVILEPTLRTSQNTSVEEVDNSTIEKNIVSNEKETTLSKKRKNNSNTKQQSKKIKISQNQEKKIFKCDVPDCNNEYETEKQLNRHKKQTHTNKDFRCTEPGCNKTYRFQSGLASHIKGLHKDGYKCTITDCNKVFKHFQDLKDHKISVHGSGYKCTFEGCDEVFNNSSGLYTHKKIAHLGGIKCRNIDCSATFSNYSDRKKHEIKEHPEQIEQNVPIGENNLGQAESSKVQEIAQLAPVTETSAEEKNSENSAQTSADIENFSPKNAQPLGQQLASAQNDNNTIEELKTFPCKNVGCNRQFQSLRGLRQHQRSCEKK